MTVAEASTERDTAGASRLLAGPTGRAGSAPGSLLARARDAAITLATVGAAIGIWALVVAAFKVPEVDFPSPAQTWHALWAELTTGGPAGIVHNGAATLEETLVGFAGGVVSGVIIGIVVAKFRYAERVAYPFISAFNALPKIALAPLLTLWFGFGILSKVVLVIAVTFFPIMVAMAQGIKGVDPDQVDLFRIMQARPWQRFVHLELPASLPQLFSGLQVAAIFSILAAVVGEFTGAQAGLGLQLLNASNNIETPAVFALLVVFGAMGLGAIGLVRLVQRRVLFWVGSDDRRGRIGGAARTR